jgi:hypothetical protein
MRQVTGGHKSNQGLSGKERKLLDKICKYYALPEWVQVSNSPWTLCFEPCLISLVTAPNTWDPNLLSWYPTLPISRNTHQIPNPKSQIPNPKSKVPDPMV